MLYLQPPYQATLQLVEEGVKPAGKISINPRYVPGTVEQHQHSFGWDLTRIALSQEQVTSIDQELQQRPVAYEVRTKELVSNEELGVSRKRETLVNLDILLGKDEESLETLRNAKSVAKEGLALGYPAEAVARYKKEINGKIRNAAYLQAQLFFADKQGIDIPSWIVYLDHVPAECDLVHGTFSEKSKLQALLYQETIRRVNPVLAQFLESQGTNIPTNVVETHNGYDVNWK